MLTDELAGRARMVEMDVREQKVPQVVNRDVTGVSATRRWRNFDAFDLGLNLAR